MNWNFPETELGSAQSLSGENEMREYERYSSPTRMILIDLSVTSRHICRSGALRPQLL